MAAIRTIFFDLDDTLYPNTNGLWEAIGKRINAFMVSRLDLPEQRVSTIRDEYLRSFGTTLNGLIANHQVDPQEYLAYVHDVPLENYLRPDPDLQQMLARMPQRKIIFTNSDTGHARRVLAILGVEAYIDRILDIVALDFINKPKPRAYTRALEITSAGNAKNCLFLDDRVENLLPAAEIGMKTTLVGDKSKPNGVDYHVERITDLLSTIPELISQTTIKEGDSDG